MIALRSGARARLTLTPPEVRANPLRRLIPAAITMTLAVVYGCAGYMLIEGFNVLDALFMTVITISTVGYELVHPLDRAGELFTVSLIAFGVGGFLYTFGVFVELLSSGRWREYWRARRIRAHLDRLRDHVIVCGYGRTGQQVVRRLLAQNHPYVVIEMNPEPLGHVLRDDQPHIVGDAASEEVLEEAGIGRARALISAVDSDERSVYIVLTARSLNPDVFLVARSSYPESVRKLQIAGADRVVSPYTTSGSRMASLALQPAMVDTVDVMMRGGEDSMVIEELIVPADAEHGHITVASLRTSGAAVLAVRSAEGVLEVGPTDAEVLSADDLVVAMGTRAQLDELGTTLRPRLRRG